MPLAATLAIVVAVVIVGPADTAPPRYELEWSAPAACPDAAHVERSIAAALDVAQSEAERDAAPLVAEGRVTQDGARYRLSLRIGDGVRELEASSCEELAATAAFIVAIAVDPRVLERVEPVRVVEPPAEANAATSAPTSTSTNTTTTTTSTSTSASGQADDGRRSSSSRRIGRFTLGGRVHAGVGVGPSPAVAGVVGLSIAAIARYVRIEVEGSWWTPREVASPRNPDVGVTAQLWTVGVRGCGVPGRGRVAVPLCAVTQAGMIHARGTGRLTSDRASQAWVGIGGGAMLVVRIVPRLSATLSADLLGAVVRGGFRSVPSGDIDRVGPIAFVGLAGLQWSLR